ncbi:hypothetical protein D3C73_911510 [compost metagenome]
MIRRAAKPHLESPLPGNRFNDSNLKCRLLKDNSLLNMQLDIGADVLSVRCLWRCSVSRSSNLTVSCRPASQSASLHSSGNRHPFGIGAAVRFTSVIQPCYIPRSPEGEREAAAFLFAESHRLHGP